MRHCGVAITRGERYLLVGFVGCARYPYATRGPAWAAAAALEAFGKFGAAAWERSASPPPALVAPTYVPID